MYMVRAADGRPLGVCENLPQAFSRSIGVSASGGLGRTVTVVALDRKEGERVVGTFQRINGDEVWCVTPMFPGGTVMKVDRGDDGVPVRRFAATPRAEPLPDETPDYCRSATQSAAADLRSLLGMVHGAPLRD